MGRIVVGMDGSAAAKEALAWAAVEAERRGDTVEVVLVWDNPYREMWLPAIGPAHDPLGHFRLALDRTVAAVLGERPDVKVETSVVEGHAAQVLVDRARGADLLVVGSRGHGVFAGAFLGSVSFNCAAHAPCPVVVVRGPAS
ncbi:MAG TPA: universal stress protein [Acidimicrobiales bacterium]|nr:universal stress protein [Acidimicrobiales bacterium]